MHFHDGQLRNDSMGEVLVWVHTMDLYEQSHTSPPKRKRKTRARHCADTESKGWGNVEVPSGTRTSCTTADKRKTVSADGVLK